MIRKVAVLGAGTMGSQIAAHVANAGIPALLLDVTDELAQSGLQALKKLSPTPLFLPERSQLIETGNFNDHLERIAEADWVVEAIVENLEIKKQLLSRVDAARRTATFVTTNTSGLPVTKLGEGRSEDFRRYWFGTHFFNPPRYLKLLEIIPTAGTDPVALASFEDFADRILGKGVVRAKDTPNFIANRIGLFAALQAIRIMLEDGYAIEEVDRLTGNVIGRARTATFRTIDMVGLDVMVNVADNIYQNAPDDPMRELFRVPEFMRAMLETRMLGAKTGKGFYKKAGDEILVLDPKTLDYRPQARVSLPSLDAVSGVDSLTGRLKALFQAEDRAGQFVWKLMMSALMYTASRIPEIAEDLISVDRAMRWGFAWEMGPFELWDALGVRDTSRRWTAEGKALPPLVEKVLASDESFYKDDQAFDPARCTYKPAEMRAGWTVLARQPVLRQNAGATLRDLGDGVACLEFHTKMNTIGGDIVSLLIDSLDEVNRNFEGLVIGNQAQNFSAGANLMLLLLEAGEGNWDEIDFMVRTFQRATRAIKYNPKPVVVAPFGMTLGGGCEIAFAGAHVQAAAETYMGLVEVGAGLIPAGGGTTEMVARAASAAAADSLPDVLRLVFENIGLAKVSTGAEHARQLLYLRPQDDITMNPERLIYDAKAQVLRLASAGYRAPVPGQLPVLGESLFAQLKLGIHLMHQAGYITEYEAHIGRKLAFILSGGDVTRPSTAPEPYFLDLEREAFLSLCGEEKTLARMEHLLKKGKPLRN